MDTNKIQVIKGTVKKHDRWNRFIINDTIVDFHLFGILTVIDEKAITVAGKFIENTFTAYGYIIPEKKDFMLGCDYTISKE